MTFYTAADLIAQKEAGYHEARRYFERLEKENESLKKALKPFAAIFEYYEQVHDLDANEVIVPYVALFNAHKALEDAREALK